MPPAVTLGMRVHYNRSTVWLNRTWIVYPTRPPERPTAHLFRRAMLVLAGTIHE